MSMPGVETSESELHERLTAILRAMPPLMQVLSVARGLCLPDWLVFSGAVYQPVLRLRPNPRRNRVGFARTAAHVRRRWPEVVVEDQP